MKYTAELGLGAMIYIPNFVKICSGIQKLHVYFFAAVPVFFTRPLPSMNA
jgi:hypothetical protein